MLVFIGALSNEAKPPEPRTNGIAPFGFMNSTKGVMEYVLPPEDNVMSNSTLLV